MKIPPALKQELQERRKTLTIKHEFFCAQMQSMRDQHTHTMQELEKVRSALEAIKALEAVEDTQ